MSFAERAEAYCQKQPIIDDVDMLVIGFNLVGSAADLTEIFKRRQVTRLSANGQDRQICLPSVEATTFLFALNRVPLVENVYGVRYGQRIPIAEFSRLNSI